MTRLWNAVTIAGIAAFDLALVAAILIAGVGWGW